MPERWLLSKLKNIPVPLTFPSSSIISHFNSAAMLIVVTASLATLTQTAANNYNVCHGMLKSERLTRGQKNKQHLSINVHTQSNLISKSLVKPEPLSLGRVHFHESTSSKGLIMHSQELRVRGDAFPLLSGKIWFVGHQSYQLDY